MKAIVLIFELMLPFYNCIIFIKLWWPLDYFLQYEHNKYQMHPCCILEIWKYWKNVNGQVRREPKIGTDLMLQAAILSFSILPNDDDVNAFVACRDSRKWLAVHYISIQVQRCPVGVQMSAIICIRNLYKRDILPKQIVPGFMRWRKVVVGLYVTYERQSPDW